MTRISEEKNRFGFCLKLSNGQVEILVALDYGPRIVSYKTTAGENLLFEDIEGSIYNKSQEIETSYGKGKVWYSRGGHRFWVAPETMPVTYYPDNARVTYEIKGDSLWVFQEPQIENGLQLKMALTLAVEGTKLKINHILKNIGFDKKIVSPWAVTVMAAGGTEIIPRSRKEEKYLPTMGVAVWPYTDLQDDRVSFGKEYIFLKQMEYDTNTGSRKAKFKIGFTNEEGWAGYRNKNQLFKKEFHPIAGGRYPDYGVSYETYTDDKIIEMESLGCLNILEPGEETSHEEIWFILDIPEEFKE